MSQDTGFFESSMRRILELERGVAGRSRWDLDSRMDTNLSLLCMALSSVNPAENIVASCLVKKTIFERGIVFFNFSMDLWFYLFHIFLQQNMKTAYTIRFFFY